MEETTTQTPAGWYPDPERPGAQRYWDGFEWGQVDAGAADKDDKKRRKLRTDFTSTARARGDHYIARVNTGRLDVERFTDSLNEWFASGYKLAHLMEQNGNTVMVFERIA
jgi:uncharacterized protein DUF2510